MRRRDREINELFEIESILSNAMVCRIGLADGGDP
jgi:nitroimidazol reductase NimA-like FMN-containing flavoprotein (pyridoxamine 5'-phosphate oxidase superfamily)